MPPSDTRLALFSDTWAPQMNGVARTLERLAGAVRSTGGQVRVFTAADPASAVGDGAVRYRSMPCPLYGQLRLAAPTPVSVMSELQAFRPTLVHIATPFGIGLAARAAARRLSLPLVTSYHTSFSAYALHYKLGWLNAPSWRFLRWFHNGGHSTLCPTSAVQSELSSRGFKRVGVWGRGVDGDAFNPRKRSRIMRIRFGADDHTTVVAYVGRMAREKGLDDILAAARSARQSRNRLVFAFAGDGPYLDSCRHRAPENCVFTGRIEGEELAEFYASADVFVFPSTTDTFGNVLLEAMASGLPIVAADAPSTREVVGCAAEYYTGGNHGMLSQTIELIVSAQGYRRVLAMSSRMRAQEYRWNRVFDDLFSLYENVTTKRQGRSAHAGAWRVSANRTKVENEGTV